MDLLHVLENTRARPIKIGPVLEDDEYVRITEHGLRPHGLDVGSSQKRRDNRIRDLVFDDAGRLPHPRCVDNDFDIGNVGERIKRDLS